MRIKLSILVVGVFIMLGCASAINWYDGPINVESENISVLIKHTEGGATAYTRGQYLLKNEGPSTEVNYEVYHLDRKVKSASMELDSNETRYIGFAQEIDLSSLSLYLNYDLKLNDAYVGKTGTNIDYSVSLPENSTVLAVSPEPGFKEDNNFSFSRKDAVAGAITPRISWIKGSVNLDLIKKTDAGNLSQGSVFNLTYVIRNNDQRKYNVTFKDTLRADYFEPVDADSYELRTGEFQFYLMRRRFSLDPNQEISFTKRIRFLGSGSPDLSPSGFTVLLDEYDYVKNSNRISLNINVCNRNNVCEPEKNENEWNCPVDCSTKRNLSTTTSQTSSTTSTSSTVTSTTFEKDDDGAPVVLYVLGGLVLLLIIGALYSASQRSDHLKELQEQERMEEWIEQQLRDGEDPKKLKSVVKGQGYDEEIVDHVLERL